MLAPICYTQPKCPVLILLLEQPLPGMVGAPVCLLPGERGERPHPFPTKKGQHR
jgi:hypothetical protein